jgi:hypothetical protein
MNRYDDTHDPNSPPNAVLHSEARSTALIGFVGSLVVFFAIVGVVLLFWTVAHPRPAGRDGFENVVGTSGYYSSEGGHDPIRRPGNTRDELKFRGDLTPPSEVRGH